MGDWRIKLKQDKNSVKKHEIARSILCRLNDAGEPALALRREVIKRVSEFDDFSSCWDNDRYYEFYALRDIDEGEELIADFLPK